MLMFVLIGLSFVLIGIVSLQFTYLFYVDRLYRERRKYMKTLEKRSIHLAKSLESAENRIKEQNKLLEAAYPESRNDEEAWADVIEDR